MTENDRALTVAQLIEQLQAMPPDLPVYTEGCDCDGLAAHVSLEDDGVWINRARPLTPEERAKLDRELEQDAIEAAKRRKERLASYGMTEEYLP